jgi:tetratricopeptide (TPR) repeat protein
VPCSIQPKVENLSYSENARAAFRRGENDTVERMSREELTRARSAGDAPGETEALYMLSRLAVRAGRMSEARRLASEGLEVAVRSGDRRLEERPRHVLAAVARMTGDLARARELYAESIALNEFLGQAEIVNSEYHNLAFTELHLGNVERARELFDDSRRRVLRNGYDTFVPYALGAAAAMAATDGDHAGAARLLGVTDRAFRELGQVPDPDDAAELDAVRNQAVDALGPAAFEELFTHGSTSDVREALANWPPNSSI